MTNTSKDPLVELPTPRASLLRIGMRLVAILGLILVANQLIGWVMMQEGTSGRVVFGIVLLAYALLISIPFVPGIEIGIGVMLMQGPASAPWVWLATIVGLTVAYLVGHLIPLRTLQNLFADLRMRKACAAIAQFSEVPKKDRYQYIRDRLPRWLVPLAGKHRYLAVALLINLPGNALLGGGGGITLLAGLTRIFRPIPTLIVLALATLPVPAAVWILGPSIIERFGLGS